MSNKIFFFCLLVMQCVAYGQTPIPFKDKNGLWGYKDGNTIIVPGKYKQAKLFSEGLAVVYKTINPGYFEDYAYGYIDLRGNEIISTVYGTANDFTDGLALVGIHRPDNRYAYDLAYIDKTGKVAFYTDKDMDYIGEFSDGFALFKIKGRYGYIDRTGYKIIPEILQEAQKFNGGIARVRDAEGFYLTIDTNFNYSSNNSMVSLIPKLGAKWFKTPNGKYGMSKGKKIVIEPIYDYVVTDIDNYAAINLGKKWGMVDSSGREIIPVRYDAFLLPSRGGKSYLTEDYFMAELSGKTCYINLSGKEVTPLYSEANPFNKGVAAVVLNGNTGWNYIDKSGKLIAEYDGPLLQTINTSIGVLEVFSSSFTDVFHGVGLRRNKQVLIFPYYEQISYKDGVITCKKGTAVRQILINKLTEKSATIIEINEKAETICSGCSGSGSYYTTTTERGARTSSTTYRQTTSVESKWNPRTNQNESYTVTKNIPVTTYTQEADKVNRVQHACSVCKGTGKVISEKNKQLIWDNYNYFYKVE